MDWSALFFKFSGRINRAKYWLACLVFAVIYLVFAVLDFFTGSMAIQAVSGMVTIVIFISSLAVGVKRLHDRSKSGWYLLFFYVAPGLLFAAGMMVGMLPDGSTVVAGVLVLASAAISLWALVELGCLRGTIGINRYGPDPIAPATVPPVRTPV